MELVGRRLGSVPPGPCATPEERLRCFLGDPPCLHYQAPHGRSVRQVLGIGMRMDHGRVLFCCDGVLFVELANRQLLCLKTYWSFIKQSLIFTIDDLEAQCNSWLASNGVLIRQGAVRPEERALGGRSDRRGLRAVASLIPIKCPDIVRALFPDRDETLLRTLVNVFTSTLPKEQRKGWKIAPADEQLMLRAMSVDVDGFRTLLCAEALSICETNDSWNAEAYGYFSSLDGTLARYRREAANAFPLFTPTVSVPPDAYRERPQIKEAIDRRLPLIDALADSYSAPKETIRFLGRKRRIDLGLPSGGREEPAVKEHLWVRSPELVLRTLAGIPVEKRPEGAPDWQVLFQLLVEFECGWISEPLFVRDFFAYVARVGWQASSASIIAHLGSISAISAANDFAAALHETVRRRLIRQSRKSTPRARNSAKLLAEQSIKTLLRSCSARPLLESSRLWHRSFNSEVDRHTSKLVRATLPSIVSESWPDGDLQIIPLVTYDLLAAEGQRMFHCVATLYRECRDARTFVFSIRNASGVSLSTFDLAPVFEGPGQVKFSVNQHRGPANSTPTGRCAETVESFVAYLAGNAERLGLAALLEDLRKKQLDRLASGESLDVHEQAVADARIDACEGVIRGRPALRKGLERALQQETASLFTWDLLE